MEPYQHEFLDFAIAHEVLRFGDFTLKSGRRSPYFFNAGLFSTGATLSRLGRYYAAATLASGIGFDMLFGPAYKGIPLAAATAIALADVHERDHPFAFDRKEAKAHGEGGRVVGAPLAGRVLIVDDVISAGTSVRGSVTLIRDAGATPAGVVIALDRQERGSDELSAVQQVENEYGIPTAAIVGLDHLIEHLEARRGMERELDEIRAYQQRYGA